MEAGDSGQPGPTAPGPVELEYSQRSENATTPSESLNWHHITKQMKAMSCPDEALCFHRPEFGGKYCTGERKRYRTCHTKPCQNDKPTFREMQCSEFDTVPYNNELYQWIPVSNPRKYSKSLNKN